MKMALTIIFLLISVTACVFVLLQEAKESGLSGLGAGSSETYWSKNKGRSKEAFYAKVTAVLTVLFLVLACLISSRWIS